MDNNSPVSEVLSLLSEAVRAKQQRENVKNPVTLSVTSAKFGKVFDSDSQEYWHGAIVTDRTKE